MKNLKTNMAVTIIASVLAFAGIALLFLEPESYDFWEMEYVWFLTFILLAPMFFVLKPMQGIRLTYLIICLALFGFLQWSCPRPPGSIEMIIIGLQKSHPVTMHLIKLGVILGSAILFSRFFCSMICPKGAIQELVHRESLAVKVPVKLDRALKYLKYVFLIALIIAPLLFEFRLFRHIGPFKVIFNLDGSWFLIGFMVVTIFASIFIGRPFCRYICPIGALLAIMAKIVPFKIRMSDSCNGCGKCTKVCPTDAIYLKERKTPVTISVAECINCRQCENVCPQNTIFFGFSNSQSGKSV